MDADTRQRRGLALLVTHSASLELETATARERLDAAVGPELARMLIFALCASSSPRPARGRPFRLECSSSEQLRAGPPERWVA